MAVPLDVAYEREINMGRARVRGAYYFLSGATYLGRGGDLYIGRLIC